MFDPYLQWLGLSPQDRPPSPFQMIGLPPGTYTAQEIHAAAEKQLQRIRLYQSGEYGFRALKLISEVLEARDTLLDPAHQKQFVPIAATVTMPVEDKAWFHEEKPDPLPPAATLEILPPDLSESKTQNWWAGDVETAPAQALSDEHHKAWWKDPAAQEVEPIVIPPSPSTRIDDEPVVEPKVAARLIEPIEPEPEPRNTKKILLLGGLVAALVGVGIVVLLKPKKSTVPVPIEPKEELVLNIKGPEKEKRIEIVKEREKDKEKEIAKEKEKPKVAELPKKAIEPKAPAIEFKEPRYFRVHAGAVWSLALTRDGSEFHSVGIDKFLYSRQLSEPKSEKRHQFLEGGLQVVHGSPANLVVACDASQVVVFDPGTNRPRLKISSPSGGFRAVALHPDGQSVLSASSDGLLRWWNTINDKMEAALDIVPGKEMTSLTLSPDGSTAMVGMVDGKVFLIDAKNRKVVHSLRVHEKKVSAVAIAPNGERGASISEDRTVQLWDLRKKSLTRKLELHPDILLGVGWSSDSQRVLSCGLDLNLRMFDANSGKLLWSSPVTEKAYCLAVDAQDRFALVGGELGTIQLIPLPRISIEEIPKEILVKPPADKLISPPVEEVKLARLKVRERYAADFERRLPAEITSLIEKLLQQGISVQHEPAYREALFDEAAELAQVARLLDEAMKIAEGRALWFLSDELEEKTQAMEFLGTKAPNQQQRSIAEQALLVLSVAQKANRYELVERLLKVAVESARFSGVKELIDRTSRVKSQIAAIQKQRSLVTEARAKLQTMPNDPEANYLFGRSLCLIEASWPTGLQHLAKGSDEKWRTLARLDLSEPRDVPTQYKLGSNWFEIAATVSEDEKANALQRARLWYEKALENGLTGTDKADALTKVRGIKGMK